MGRSPASFQKRQRELAKREKQQLKAERRAQRKSGELEAVNPDEDILTPEQPDHPADADQPADA